MLAGEGQSHYMRGGKPGFFPSLKKNGIPFPVGIDLWDPFGFASKQSDEKKARSLRAEVTESARACRYILSKQVQKICSFWLLTLWLLTVPSFSI